MSAITTRDVLFGLLALLVAASAVLAVTTRQIVHAALWLIAALGGLAGCYLVLGAEVIALVQILVYVGAVVVLVLFALMLTRAPIGPSTEVNHGVPQRIVAAVVAAATTGLLGAGLVLAVGDRTLVIDPTALDPAGSLSRTAGAAGVAASRSAAQPLATSLFGAWALPFEVLSLLLLAALIAALVLSRPDSVAEPTTDSLVGSTVDSVADSTTAPDGHLGDQAAVPADPVDRQVS